MSKTKSLTTPYLDFWLLGGLSILLYFVMALTTHTPLGQDATVARHMANVGPVFTMLTIFVNFPHFLWSYKLAYFQSPGFVSRNWPQLILAPACLIVLFCIAYFSWNTPLDSNPLSLLIASFLGLFGVSESGNLYPNLGSQILGLLLVFQFAIVGWHYVKQTFGVMMACAAYTKYPLTGEQRKIVKWNLFGIWWIMFFNTNTGTKVHYLREVVFHSLNFPDWLVPIAQIYLLCTFILVITKVVLPIFQKEGILPPPTVVVPFISMYLWFPPITQLYHHEYFIFVVPFAHSLQYLCFIYKVESKSKETHSPKQFAIEITWLIFAVIGSGLFFIEYLPAQLDELLAVYPLMKVGFFMAAFQIFINIHHYFIDNAIWQKKNSEVKGRLFA